MSKRLSLTKNTPTLLLAMRKRMTSFNNFTILIIAMSTTVLGVFVSALLYNAQATKIFASLPFLQFILDKLVSVNALPLIIISIPVLGGILQFIFQKFSEKLRDVIVVLMTFIALVLILMLYPAVVKSSLVYTIKDLLGVGLSFRVDMLGFTMLLLTSIIWYLVMIYSHEYVMFEKHRNRFYLFLAITYSAILGTIMAGDLLTLFLFFEIMTFSSYMLVTHGQKAESFNAGYNYIFMGLVGGYAILLALIMIYSAIGHVNFVPSIVEINTMGNMKYVAIGLLIFGFGIKAGMAPVHVWLPRAHPVAPTPASALLSGIMIKIGAFGILRVTTSFFFPAASQITDYKDVLWESSRTLGVGVIWLGIITMAIGVFFALQQSNMKKMLAYHSISQMGYILLGIGVALYLGYKGAMGYSGALYHIINHALFKSLLFMVAGVVYLYTHELDMYKLGGLWRKLPVTAIICLIAVLGITGMPLFNGFASKSLLHHAVIESYEYGHSSFRYAEIMFNIISAGTVTSFIKLFGFVFLGKLPERFENLKRPKINSMHMAMAGVAAIIVSVGLFPNFVQSELITPALYQTTFDPAFIAKYITPINFFNFSDMSGMIWIYALGISIFYFGIKYHWFHLHLPKWASIEFILSYPVNKLMSIVCKIMGNCGCDDEVDQLEKSAFNLLRDDSYEHEPSITERMAGLFSIFSNKYEKVFIKNDVFIFTLGLTLLVFVLMIFS